MEKNYQFLNMDINKPIHRKLTAIQYDDKTRYILVSVFSNFMPYDLTYTTVKIYGIKGDKTVFFNNARIVDAKAGKFEIDLTEQCLAVAGDTEIQILILGANQERLSSNSFVLNVKKSIIDPLKITSQSEWGVLVEGLSSLAEYDIYKNNVDRHSEEIESNTNKIDIISKNRISLDSFPRVIGETDDNNRFERAIEYLKNREGGEICVPPGEYFVKKIRGSNNIHFLGFGSNTVINQIENAGEYMNVFEFHDCKNWSVKNLDINGNRKSQSNYHSGIYTAITQNGLIENVNITDVYGEGLFLGYSEHLSENIIVRNCTIKNSSRNEVCIGNASNVLFENVDIVSSDAFSATVDFEKHKNGDIHKNIELKNCRIKCGTTPVKLITNGYIGEMDSILFNNCKVNGGINLDLFNNVKFINACNASEINIIACKNIDLGDTVVSNSSDYGIYIADKNSTKCENIISNNLTVSGCKGIGVIISNSMGISFLNPNIVNNKIGMSIQYACKNIHLTNGKITDTRIDKTQEYAIEFISTTHSDIHLNNVYIDGNKTGQLKDKIDGRVIVNGFDRKIEIANKNTNSMATIEFDDNENLKINRSLFSTTLGLVKQYDSSVDFIKNGSIFEDSRDGNLKYKNLAGVIKFLS